MKSRTHQEIFNEIRERGLITMVVDRCRAKRLGRMARSTYYLARDLGPTTPAQRLVCKEAEALLNELDQKEEQPAEQNEMAA